MFIGMKNGIDSVQILAVAVLHSIATNIFEKDLTPSLLSPTYE